METFLSALASDLAGRLFSFAVDRYQKQAATDKLARLRGLLFRARTVVEEAECRHVTNRGMLLQLQGLRDAIYRGHYALDRPRHATATNGGAGRAAAAPDSDDMNRLQDVLEILQRTMSDLKEFVVLLGGCPRVPPQPYSAYLFMERCMFGRHAEKERIIAFLLQPCSSSSSSSPGVLPVVGSPEVGKGTLVEHVCAEKRVRERFPQITRISTDDLQDSDRDYSAARHRTRLCGGERSLVIVEFVSDVDDDAWRRFHSSVAAANSSSKIIITSRMTQRAARLGTVPALTLRRLRPCEYHYFFKVLAFGSANPDDHHPALASIAADLAAETNAAFVPANALASLLRSNLDARFWRNVLKMVRDSIRLHHVVFGKHPSKLVWRNSPHYLCCSDNDTRFFAYNRCKMRRVLRQGEVPEVRLHDLMAGVGAGDAAVHCEGGKLDVLIWQSQIPPYCSYISNCVVKNAEQIVSKNNGRLKRKRELT